MKARLRRAAVPSSPLAAGLSYRPLPSRFCGAGGEDVEGSKGVRGAERRLVKAEQTGGSWEQRGGGGRGEEEGGEERRGEKETHESTRGKGRGE